MAIMNPSPVQSTALMWDAETRRFVGEISDLGPHFRFGRVYDDACDAGMTLLSRYDGRQMVFAISHEERDDENDVLWWDLTSVLPGDATFTIRLYND